MPTTMNITNDADLQRVMKSILKDILSTVSKKVLKHLQENLRKYIYSDVPLMYERTWQFYNAWNFSKIEETVNALTTELWYDSDKVQYNPEKWQHGNRQKSSKEKLMEILNQYGPKSPGFTSRGKMDYETGRRVKKALKGFYWDKTVSELFDGGLIQQWFELEATKYNIRRT